MILSTTSRLPFLARGPSFSNFLNRSSTVRWSFFNRVMASMPGRYPGVSGGKPSRAKRPGYGKIRPWGTDLLPGQNMHALLAVGGAVLGLAVGSFLNVVIWRVPRKLSVV